MQHFAEAYLDIETMGLSPTNCDITVVGIYLCDGSDTRFIQLVGKDITAGSISDSLEGVSKIHTYNYSNPPGENPKSLLFTGHIDNQGQVYMVGLACARQAVKHPLNAIRFLTERIKSGV